MSDKWPEKCTLGEYYKLLEPGAQRYAAFLRRFSKRPEPPEENEIVKSLKCSCNFWLEKGHELLQTFPMLERITLDGKSPTRRSESGPYRWYCMNESGYSSTYILPEELYLCLNGKGLGVDLSIPDLQTPFCEYDTEEEVYGNLSQACIAYARRRLREGVR